MTHIKLTKIDTDKVLPRKKIIPDYLNTRSFDYAGLSSHNYAVSQLEECGIELDPRIMARLFLDHENDNSELTTLEIMQDLVLSAKDWIKIEKICPADKKEK